MSRSTPLAVAAATLVLAGLAAAPAVAGEASEANIAIVLVGGAPQGPTQAQGGATYRVTARVPVACWVRPDTTVVVAEGLTGSVVEACNNPGGFSITVSYRALKPSEKAQIVYDNRAVDLSKAGAQILRQSSMAVIKRVSYRFQSVELDDPLVLSLTIQPI